MMLLYIQQKKKIILLWDMVKLLIYHIGVMKEWMYYIRTYNFLVVITLATLSITACQV